MAQDNKVVDMALPPIIVIKRKKGHAGHHGGAWKVAYADFVTAMMALFIVLWLLNSAQDVRKAIGGYFVDPKGVGKAVGSGLAGSGESLAVGRTDMEHLKDKLAQAVKRAPELQKLHDQIDMIVTGEGLRIELLESDKNMFFETGRPQPTVMGNELISMLAAELGKLPNRLMIEGHTDSTPYGADGAYSNWELSADRANAARHLMEAKGLHPHQVSQVRGFADENLRKPAAPNDFSNRRISVIVQYVTAPESPEGEGGEKKGEKHEEKGGKKEGGEKKGEEKKGEEKKSEEKKSGDKKSEEKKNDEKKGDEKKGEEKKGEDKKPAKH